MTAYFPISFAVRKSFAHLFLLILVFISIGLVDEDSLFKMIFMQNAIFAFVFVVISK